MLVCDGVVKKYGPRFTLGPVSFTLGYGEILGVVGANGSGKTSLLRILAGELSPDTGHCEIAGRDAGDRPFPVPVMLVPESPPPWSGSMEQHLSWQAAIFGYDTDEENALRVEHVLAQLDIGSYRQKSRDQLSDGIRMRVAIAAALLANPGLIVLDEPLGALDPLSQQDLLRWMRVHAGGDRRTSFVLAAHHVAELEAMADQVLFVAPDAEARAMRPREAQRRGGTHYRLVLEPGADRAELLARLEALGEGRSVVEEMPSYVLVHAALGPDIELATLAERVAGTGVGSIQDLSQSHLRLLLWRKHA